MILEMCQKIKNLKLGYLTQQMTLNSNATVFEEMSKPFEHIKRMESLIKEETDWLSKHANDYDSDTYKTHMSRYESLSNQFEQLEGYQYESKIKTVLYGLNLVKKISINLSMILAVAKKHVYL